MDFSRCLLFFIISLHYDIVIVWSSEIVSSNRLFLPSCDEFNVNIISRDEFIPKYSDILIVGRAYRLTEVDGGRCSLFNFHENCGSIHIYGNFFNNETSTVEIIGFDKDGLHGEVYGFAARRRPNSKLHIYDFTPEYKRVSWIDENGDVRSNAESLRQTPRHIKNRLNFTIALVSANKNDVTTVMGFRFCRKSGDLDDLFIHGGFIAYDDQFVFDVTLDQSNRSTRSITEGYIDHMLDIVVQLARDKKGRCLLESLSDVPRDNTFVTSKN